MKNNLLTHIQRGNEKQWKQVRKNYRSVIAIFAANQTGHWNISARRGEHNANNSKQMGHFAKVCKSKTVNRIKEEPITDSHIHSWPEIDHMQSFNGSNRIDFYKAILLVQGQPIEVIIDTASPVTIIPPIISPVDLQKPQKDL